jgi:hypothetical protein
VLLIAPSGLGPISNASVTLSLEAQRPLVCEFDRILSEPLAMFDETVHVDAAEDNRFL